MFWLGFICGMFFMFVASMLFGPISDAIDDIYEFWRETKGGDS